MFDFKKKITGMLSVMLLLLALIMSSMPVLAEDTAKRVYVRIESCVAGKNETLLPRTKVMVENFDMLEFGAAENPEHATALQALIAAVGKDNVEFGYGQYGVFITSILGTEDDGACSWMYATANDVSPWVGSDAYFIEDGYEIVFYFISWEDTSYSWFDKTNITVKTGENVNLTLSAQNFNDGIFAVEGAAVSISGGEDEFGEIATDEAGAASIKFENAGQYIVSAEKKNDNGSFAISRPSTLVNVVAAEDYLLTCGSAGVGMAIGGLEINYDVPAAKVGGTLLFPLRAVAESLGAEVSWDSAAQAAKIVFAGEAIVLPASGDTTIVNGRILVPAEYIEANFGLGVRIGE